MKGRETKNEVSKARSGDVETHRPTGSDPISTSIQIREFSRRRRHSPSSRRSGKEVSEDCSSNEGARKTRRVQYRLRARCMQLQRAKKLQKYKGSEDRSGSRQLTSFSSSFVPSHGGHAVFLDSDASPVLVSESVLGCWMGLKSSEGVVKKGLPAKNQPHRRSANEERKGRETRRNRFRREGRRIDAHLPLIDWDSLPVSSSMEESEDVVSCGVSC